MLVLYCSLFSSSVSFWPESWRKGWTSSTTTSTPPEEESVYFREDLSQQIELDLDASSQNTSFIDENDSYLAQLNKPEQQENSSFMKLINYFSPIKKRSTVNQSVSVLDPIPEESKSQSNPIHQSISSSDVSVIVSPLSDLSPISEEDTPIDSLIQESPVSEEKKEEEGEQLGSFFETSLVYDKKTQSMKKVTQRHSRRYRISVLCS